MLEIQSWNAQQARGVIDELAALLQDAVDSGASVGFLPPLGIAEAREYWAKVCDVIHPERRILLAALSDGRLTGSVQLDLAAMPNGSHRAEVMKLMVRRDARRHGIGRTLMSAIEEAGQRAGRSLLVLDTRAGDAAEQLYLNIGYTRAGVIPKYARGASGELHDTVILYKFV
jgi:GNAT superfamily N-acetyltransferase